MRTGEALTAGVPPSWELTTIIGGRPKVHLVPRGVLVLGRGSQADLALDDASVSRQHVALHLGDEVFVEDLGSANGTRLITTTVDTQLTARTEDARLAPRVRVLVPATASIHAGSVILLLRPVTPATAAPAVATKAAQNRHEGLVYVSEAMGQVVALLERIAPSPLSVLLIGETGVGKDVLARAIHAASPRQRGPYVPINCAALAEHLVESELFGHEKGAFTGAAQAKAGILEAASSGTAFLDEIGELPLGQQGKLLRALEAGEISRVGALKPRPIDVRFVAATNRDLAAESDRGAFRRDLYFRLDGMTLRIPPLRERREDVLPIALSFIERAATKAKIPAPGFSEASLRALASYPFPGNVRELRNVVERAVALSAGEGLIEPSHLILPTVATPLAASSGAASGEEEKRRILDALARCAGNQTRAAAMLGISRRTLVSRLAQYGIARPRGEG